MMTAHRSAISRFISWSTVLAFSALSLACATVQPGTEPSQEPRAKTETMASDAKAKARAMEDELIDELVNPPEFQAESGVLDADLRIEAITVTGEENPLASDDPYRWYGFPSDGSDCPDSDSYVFQDGRCYGAPGPTLRMRRQSDSYPDGDRLNVTLTNGLAAVTDPDVGHDCNYEGVDETPNCFHGDDITNYHFHGFHVSPNPNDDMMTYSDYVLMKLWPENSTIGTCEFPDCKIGTAEYDLDSLIQYQPEGTHWYHPHKHASTALQVSNGMAGALIVEGPYDDWLADKICIDAPESCEFGNGIACEDATTQPCRVKEKILILQQLFPTMGFPVSTGQPGAIYINGQADPTITMRPGEIQRWRFLNAGIQSSANYAIEFPSELYGQCGEGGPTDWCIKQIAMDGVPFVEANYDGQPLLMNEVTSGDNAGNCEEGGDGNPCFILVPGNRADFLVQAPMQATGTHRIGIDFQGAVLEFLPEKMRDVIGDRLEAEFQRLAKEAPGIATSAATTETTIFRARFDGTPISRLTLPDTTDYPYLASGDDNGPYSSPRNLVEDIDATTTADPLEFKMTGYTGGTIPSWSGDDNFRSAINQAIKCCRQWNPCGGDPTKKNCCESAMPGFCYDTSPPPGGEDVPCGALIGQFWINDEQFSDATNYSAALGSKVNWDWENAVGKPKDEALAAMSTNLAESCPPLAGEEFDVQVKVDGEVEAFTVSANLVECASGYCVSGELNSESQPETSLPDPPFVQHPIHIHVNPFQVERANGLPAVFQDTIGLPTTASTPVTIRQEYRSYDGTFVFHCHILGHEDRGMMQKFAVTPTAETLPQPVP